MSQTKKVNINRLAFLFAVTYMVSYITRINYGAVIAEMVEVTGWSKAELSMALTGSFITYGAGQIISGICGDRFNPKRLIMNGLLLSIAMNLLIPLCHSPYLTLIVWSVNGFAQAFMWPPMVKILAELTTPDEYKKSCAKISWGSSFGTIAVYLLAPILISVSSWKAVFFVSALCGIIMVFVWKKLCPEVEIKSAEKTDKAETASSASTLSLVFTPVMIFIMIAIALQGILRDGVTTWMPSYISETYNLGSEISILTGVILPLFSIACFQIGTYLYRKVFTNPLICAGVFFAAGAVSALALYLLSGANAAFSVLFSAILTGCMHGVNLMLICMIPPFFEKYGKVSTVSGIVNSCTYIGSAISSYGIAVLSENMGWSFTLFTWLAIALAGTLICFILAKPWKKYEEV